MRKLVNNRELSDVTFIVDGFPVYASRVHLALRSEHFRAMLYGGMRESEKGAEIEIKVCVYVRVYRDEWTKYQSCFGESHRDCWQRSRWIGVCVLERLLASCRGSRSIRTVRVSLRQEDFANRSAEPPTTRVWRCWLFLATYFPARSTTRLKHTPKMKTIRDFMMLDKPFELFLDLPPFLVLPGAQRSHEHQASMSMLPFQPAAVAAP